jgi:hypothetical protein
VLFTLPLWRGTAGDGVLQPVEPTQQTDQRWAHAPAIDWFEIEHAGR